jgi:hypothetical protein
MININDGIPLWDAQFTGEVKVHFGRLIENGLAVGTKLKHWRIKDKSICLVCGEDVSLVHHVWSCSHSSTAWTVLEEKT